MYFPVNFPKLLRKLFYRTPAVAAFFKCCQNGRKKEHTIKK